MAHLPLKRSILVGAVTFIGCNVALYALYESLIAQFLGGLTAILSLFSPSGPKQQSIFWPPLLLAGVAVVTAIAINAWSLWWSKSKPQGGHFVFQIFTFASAMVTLGLTLFVSVSVVLMQHPAWLDDPFGSKAEARKREGDAALASEMAREEAHRLEMEERNAKIDRERAMRKQ